MRRALRGTCASGLVATAIAAAGACKPSLNDTVSIVTSPRVLAVRVVPAEVAPKGAITLSALVADDKGTVQTPPLDWAYCEERKPLAELGPVSPLCMVRDADYLTPLGGGAQTMTAMPEDACREFGPDVPVAKPGEPVGRPVDADLTGGYYQPLRLALSTAGGDAFTLAQARISCGIANATSDEFTAFTMGYHLNVNPELDALAMNGAMLPADDSGMTTNVPAGSRVTFHASWAPCADPTMTCTGAETYVRLDLTAAAVVPQREAIRASWFATAGSFDQDHTGRDSGDMTSFSENGWVAPSQPGPVHVWVVLRDERGGTGWKGFALNVQ